MPRLPVRVAALLIAVTFLTPLPAACAQMLASSPVRFGLTAGATPPLTSFSNTVNSGWNAGGLVELGFPLVPLGFRFDAEWHQLGTKTFGASLRQRARIVSTTLDVTYALGSQPVVRPYVIAGLGGYAVKSDRLVNPTFEVTSGADTLQSGSVSQFRFGLNAGFGVRLQLAPVALFLEARWHSIFINGSTMQMMPISIGITI